ncbi:MAG: hypothetical protein E7466_00860 [Ruminococcaceae bacterium]|nr:hypothetical protein [Oscillospiraceae bacterium]
MGYKIKYTAGNAEKIPFRFGKRKIPLRWLLLGVLLLALILPVGRNALGRLLLPGDAEVTGQALQALASDLQTGTDFPDAITAFCHHILEESGH